ncbi:unnamed protein product, partial [Heterotrigona itama]
FCCIAIILVIACLLTSIILNFVMAQNKFQIRCMSYFIDLSNDWSLLLGYSISDIICLNAAFITAVGMMSISCTELSVIIFAHYFSALFKITG